MHHILRSFALIALLAGPMVCASADPYKDESGHGKGRHGHKAYKEEYWDGQCKVERKWEKNGGYKEERKCKGRQAHRHDYDEPRYVSPQPGVIVQPPAVVIQPNIVIRP